MRGVLLLAVTGACVGTETATCPGSGNLCPEGTVCLQLAPDDELCVRPDQFPPCDGEVDRTACTLAGDLSGTCYGGACLPAECGNLRLDAGEACDDGANRPGDGCSADCRSHEVCGNGIVDPVRLEGEMFVPDEQCDDGNLLGHDGCSSMCRPETTRWVEIVDEAPLPRGDSAMTYDASRARIVMFGGSKRGVSMTTSLVSYGDSWAWDRGWKRMEVPVPPQERHRHAIAYDPKHQQVVLFGGQGVNILGDTWILDGERWKEASITAAPSARAGHAMAYHPRLGVVMFGGGSPGVPMPDEIWVWDGATWKVLAVPARPPGRAGHAMAFDPARGVIVMYGGGGHETETWEFDGATWTERANGPRRIDATIGYDPIQRRVILFGGSDSAGSIAETWSWSGQAWTQLATVGGPAARDTAAMANDPETGELIMFGGNAVPDPVCLSCGIVALGDTWRWSGSAWTEVTRSAPSPTAQHVAALDLARRRIVTNQFDFTTLTSKTWEFDGVQWYLRRNGPPVGSEASMAYDAPRAAMVLFGGIDPSTAVELDDTWTWDGTSWTARVFATSPPARASHVMASDLARGRVVLFGGKQEPFVFGDTWEWDGATWTDVTPATASPSPRSDATMAWDPIRQRVLLFGGLNDQLEVVDDSWEWDGSTWTQLDPPQSPSARKGAGMAWDGQRRRMVLFGGGGTFGGGAAFGSDAWEWDGTTWTYVAVPASPLSRDQHVVVSAPSGDGVFVYGGLQDELLGDLWHLRRDSVDSYETCHTPIDDDGDGLAGCADPDCWPACSPWRPPGAPYAASAPRCGDGVCNPELENCRMCADCTCVARCGDWSCDTGETATTCPGDCPI